MIKEGKSLRTMQLDDIAAAGISPDLPKWVHAWLFESLKSVITSAISISVEKDKPDLKLDKEIVKSIISAALIKHKQLAQSFLNDEIAAELSNLYFSFITNSVVYDFFKDKAAN